MISDLKYKMVFLILNYETYWETFKCVDSIYECVGKERIGNLGHKIVIVDNGSTNDSVNRMNQKYRDNEGIIVLSNEKNLGFARGNNVGFVYAKKLLSPDFIVMINSDIIMNDLNFERKVLKEFKTHPFAVAGPNVLLKNGQQLNPQISELTSIDAVDISIKKTEFKLKLCKLGIEPAYVLLQRIFKNILERKTKRKKILEGDKVIQIHGCFLIFSKHYINIFDGLNEKTFLYGEETLLRMRCERAGIKMRILYNISALHNESRTEKYIGGKINERHKIRNRNVLQSLQVIRDYMLSSEI